MKKYIEYEYLKITVDHLINRIMNSGSWALHHNAFIEGSIVSSRVAIIDDKEVFHQFECTRFGFRDLGLTA